MSPGDNYPVGPPPLIRPYQAYFDHQRQLSREAEKKRLVETRRQEEGAFILGWCAVGCAALLAALMVTR